MSSQSLPPREWKAIAEDGVGCAVSRGALGGVAAIGGRDDADHQWVTPRRIDLRAKRVVGFGGVVTIRDRNDRPREQPRPVSHL